MNLVPFAAQAHLPDAARLLTQRQEACCAADPALPAVGDAAAVIQALLAKPRSAAVAAIEAGRLCGYTIGNLETAPAVRGRSAWTYAGGQAIAPGQDPGLYADMYAHIFPQWLEQGAFSHYAMVPAADQAALGAWFALGFGMEQVHAIRETAPADQPAPSYVRIATPADLDLLKPIIHLIAHHQVLAPCWGANLPEADADRVEGWAEVLADETCTTFMALDDEGKAAGFLMLSPADPGLMVPERCIGLDVAATRPDLRGRGIMQAMTRGALDHAYRAGYTHMLTDWRSTNLLSSRAWPRLGFRPTHYRLTRRIDEKILWAR